MRTFYDVIGMPRALAGAETTALESQKLAPWQRLSVDGERVRLQRRKVANMARQEWKYLSPPPLGDGAGGIAAPHGCSPLALANFAAENPVDPTGKYVSRTAVHQLQHGTRLVLDRGANHHCELAGRAGAAMGRADWWRIWSCVQNR